MRESAADLFDEGLGYKAAASRLGVGREVAREWAYAYRALGREGVLHDDCRRRKYSAEVKLSAVRDRLDGVSVAEVMKRYGVANRRQVREWCLLYQKLGSAAFAQRGLSSVLSATSENESNRDERTA
ncbi:helix-turn-helix domain-containing protein [Gordonibacter sp. An230]|uniref:helix-turn-helix domain-containing protein n=1 Tax=Gordonibacter sp. An230 TaxID=1965592 RepID=UPI0013A6128F|nr:helix-turn-helix domain-containing protein [Gordonibacter sp. An230]